MSLGMAPMAVSLLLLGQAPVRGDKEFEVPVAFTKKVPESVDDLKAIEKHVRELTKKLMPATVGIQIGPALGSGVIIDAEGHVLTAAHVSGDPGRNCNIILPDGRRLKGKTLGANRTIDGGMILITEKAEFTHLEMSKSSTLKRGDWCLALGHPGGFQAGRTPPLRLGRILEVNPSYLRTDCTLVGGDSGGPLFDMTGKVIGIHSRIGERLTANIHVPVDPYRDNFDKLAKAEVWGSNNFGGFSEAFLGATMLNDAKLVKVQTVMPKSPAEKAGLKVDDLILKFDGQQVGSAAEFTKMLRRKNPGNEVSIDIRRGEETIQVRVVLGKGPPGKG
jgi:serine protease Do